MPGGVVLNHSCHVPQRDPTCQHLVKARGGGCRGHGGVLFIIQTGNLISYNRFKAFENNLIYIMKALIIVSRVYESY